MEDEDRSAWEDRAQLLVGIQELGHCLLELRMWPGTVNDACNQRIPVPWVSAGSL